jgi:hypothetical protein
MRYVENMSGWTKALQDHRIKTKTFIFQEDRLSEIMSLIRSGLPTFEYHILSLPAFLSKKAFVQKIFKRYEGRVVIRAIPFDSKYQRFTLINKTYEVCKKLLHDKVDKQLLRYYKITINEYDPAAYSGVVISAPSRLIIEMVAEPDLEGLSHGRSVPWHAEFLEYFPYTFRKMVFYGSVEQSIKEKMWQIVQLLSSVNDSDGAIPNVVPMIGDFEFVISKKAGAIKFVDFKQVWWKLFN